MMKSMSGTTAAIGAWLFALSSTEPPIATEYPAGSAFRELLDLRRELIHDRLRLHGVEDACLERDRRKSATAARLSAARFHSAALPRAPSGTDWPPEPINCRSRSVSIDARSGAVARPTTFTR